MVSEALALLAVLCACASACFAVVVPVAALLANRRLTLRGEERHVSSVPIIGTIAGCLAIALLPIGTLRERFVWVWVPVAAETMVLAACIAYWRLSGLEKASKRLRQAQRS